MWTQDHEQRQQDLRRLKERIRDQHLDRNGVVGMSVGFKSVGGKETDELVIKFHVARKEAVPKERAVPRGIEGVKTDVVETDFQPYSFEPTAPLIPPMQMTTLEAEFGPPDTGLYIWMPGGISAGSKRKVQVGQAIHPGPATSGLIVTDIETGAPMILSNCHALCCNDGNDAEGDEICQPDRFDWQGRTAACATLQRWAAGSYRIDGVDYGIDAAVASLARTFRRVDRAVVRDVGQVAFTGTLKLTPGTQVRKRGRTTKLTTGEVISTDLDIVRDFGGVVKKKRLYNQIHVKAGTKEDGKAATRFAAGGDSGSVLLAANTANNSTEVVGLLWGGEDGGTAACSPIGPVLKQLNIRI
jgi:hypothetical protein